MLKGKAKVDYQREYMRTRRKKHLVRPSVLDPLLDAISPSISREGYGKASSTVKPEIDADGNVIYVDEQYVLKYSNG